MDQEVFDIISRIAEEHSGPKKIFGYLTEEDLKNEIWVICLDKLKDFDGERGKLEHFLRVSVKNRLINRYKDVAKVVKSPCPRCPFYDPGKSPSDCSKFGDDRYLCKKWKRFESSRNSRNSLLNATEQMIEREFDEDTLSKLSSIEIKELLFENISSYMKKDLQCFFDGYKLSKVRAEKLFKEINKILKDIKFKNTGFTQLTINNAEA